MKKKIVHIKKNDINLQCQTTNILNMKKFRILTLAALFAVSFAGCKDDDKNCDDQMADIVAQYGEPDAKQDVSSGDVHIMQYVYYNEGKQFVFTWGKGYKECSMVTQTITSPF